MPGHHKARKANHYYVNRSIFVWEQTHKKQLPKGWIVHHKNRIKVDDRPDNLEAMPDREHKILHKIKELKIG
jgi:predicted protein tyrosine phosphatase